MSDTAKTVHTDQVPLVLWEDEYFLALWKPLGFVCEEDAKGRGVPQWLRRHRPDLGLEAGMPGLLHRLDAPVTGVLLLGKTEDSVKKGFELFKGREITKIYWAWLEGQWPHPKGRLKHYLSRPNSATGKVRCSKTPFEEAREALLDFEIFHQGERYTCVSVKLITGRTHQIRAQFSDAGFPIKGDLKYGAKRSNPGGGISLHGRTLEFIHPYTHEKIRVRANPPEDALWKLLPQEPSAVTRTPPEKPRRPLNGNERGINAKKKLRRGKEPDSGRSGPPKKHR